MRSVSTVCAVSFLSGLESRTSSSQSRPRHLFSDAIHFPPHTSAISPLPLSHGVFQMTITLMSPFTIQMSQVRLILKSNSSHYITALPLLKVTRSYSTTTPLFLKGTISYSITNPTIVEGDSIFHNKPPLLKGTPSYSKSYWSPPPPLPKGRGEREMMSEAERDAFAKLSDEEVIAEHEKLFPPGKPMHPRENGREFLSEREYLFMYRHTILTSHRTGPVHMGMIDELSEVVEAQDGEVLALEKEVNNEKRVVILFNYVTPQI